MKLFFAGLKEIVDSENIVVVTDGKLDYVALVKSMWPDAIHVAQFHERDVLGQVHIYFRYEGEDYAIRMTWDIFIKTEVMENVVLPAEVEDAPYGRKTQIGKYRVTKIKLFKKTVLYPYRPKQGKNLESKKELEEKTSEGVVEKETELREIELPKKREVRVPG